MPSAAYRVVLDDEVTDGCDVLRLHHGWNGARGTMTHVAAGARLSWSGKIYSYPAEVAATAAAVLAERSRLPEVLVIDPEGLWPSVMRKI